MREAFLRISVPIGSLMLYVASFAISLGPIVSLTFLLLIDALGRSGAFWLYGAIGILTFFFCWKYVPETKGKRLEDSQEFFQERVERRGAAA